MDITGPTNSKTNKVIHKCLKLDLLELADKWQQRGPMTPKLLKNHLSGLPFSPFGVGFLSI